MPILEARRVGVRVLLQEVPICDENRDGVRMCAMEKGGKHEMTTGERIREIRRDQNISQTQLAQAAGLNQPQVSAIEGGRVKPSAKTIEKIATALHVPVESITNEQPKPDPTFTPYQVMLIYKAIQHRIDEEINRLADGMQVDKSEVLRVWEEHKND